MDALVNVSVIYYSSTGMVAELAKEIAEAAKKAGGDVRLRKVAELAPAEAIASVPAWAANVEATAAIPDAAPDDILWADAVIFGTPTRFGNVSSQLKQFLDGLGGQWQQGLLTDKVYSAFTSTATHHGGQEATLLALSNSFYHFGGIIVPPGYSHEVGFVNGNPYGTSHWDQGGEKAVDDTTRTAAQVQAERVVHVAQTIKTGRNVNGGPLRMR